MDFGVRNKYIKKFLSTYPNLNGLKLIKYLTIIGIDTVKKLYKAPISYEVIQNLAKSLSAGTKKEDVKIKKEISNLKNDILKLTEKFDQTLKKQSMEAEELRNLSNEQTQMKKMKSSSILDTQKSNSQMLKTNAIGKLGELLSPTEAQETARINHRAEAPNKRSQSTEGSVHPDWWKENCKLETKGKRDITPKITEIEAPKLPIKRDYTPVRNHLDDQMIKKLLYDDDLPDPNPRQTSKTPKENGNNKEIPREQPKVTQTYETEKAVHEQEKPPTFQSPMSLNPHTNAYEDFYSPNFPGPEKSENKAQMSTFGRQEFENHGILPTNEQTIQMAPTNANSKPKPHAGIPKKDKQRNDLPRHKNTRSTKGLTEARANSISTPPNEFAKKNAAAKSQASRRVLNQTSVQNHYEHVQSKLKDDPLFQRDKSIGRRHSIQRYEPPQQYETISSEGLLTSGRSREFSPLPQKYQQEVKQLKGEKNGNHYAYPEANKENISNNLNAYSDKEGSGLLDSLSSPSYRDTNDRKAPLAQNSYSMNNRTRGMGNSYMEDQREPIRLKRTQQTRSAKNLLGIANNFLNSPLMQHLSSQEGKGSLEFSNKGQNSHPNTLNPSQVNISEFDPKSSAEKVQPMIKRSYYADESDKSDSSRGNHQQAADSHRHYSDWVGTYDFTKSRDRSGSIARDPNNRRQSSNSYQAKDSLIEKNNGQSSLSSSYFSNFNINEDMKGFYQNVFWENNRSRDSSARRPRRDSNMMSDNSSSLSFNGDNYNSYHQQSNETNLSKKNYESSKSYGQGNSIDNNPFKQHRMSVTRILNNA